MLWSSTTQLLLNSQYIHTSSSHHLLVMRTISSHRGPFQVLDRTYSIYTIEDLISGKRSSTHIHNLRPFNYDPARTSPLTIAQQNEQEFVVEPQSQIYHGVQSPIGWIRRILRQLGALQDPFTRRQTTRLPEGQYY